MGPLVEITLERHPKVIAALPPGAQSPTVRVKLMIDTGAQKTVIENSVAQQLGLTPIRFTPMVGVSQKPEQCPVYLASIRIGFSDPNGGTAQLLFHAEVVGMESPPVPQEHRGLLGRDFLVHVDRFVYDGKAGTFDLVLNPPPGTVSTPAGFLTRDEHEALRAKRKAERHAKKKARRH